MLKKLTAAAIVLCVSGCASLDETSSGDDSSTTSAPLTFSPTATQQMLDLVNYPTTDATVLTSGAGLTDTTANNIITLRNGPDGLIPSGDDVYFNTLKQLDDVSGVGTSSLTKLATYAAAHPAPPSETVKTVAFLGWESQAVVWGVNQATAAALDALLDDRAATSLLGHRPFTSVTQMGALSYVSAAQLDKLLGSAGAWWSQRSSGTTPGGGTTDGGTPDGGTTLAGRFDGAIFDEAQAELGLQIANQATLVQLTAHHMTSTAGKDIIGARPFTTLAQVSAVSGVGQATMNALLGYVNSGDWAPATSACITTFDAAVGPHLSALLFMSESDRPFDLVSFPGQGTSAPTGASLMALVGSVAGSTPETRDPNNYYVAFEASGAGADPNAAAAVQAAFTSELTDVVYIAIHPPASSIDNSLVDVYLVGRTSCGDLVGIHSISVET